MPRALGVDLGSRRIGLALSDPSGTAASPLAVLDRARDRSADHEAIVAAAREHDADVIVVGLPITMEGDVGTAARRVLAEVEALRQIAGPISVETHDERLSTVTAERAMVEGGARRARRRDKIDQVAAAVILQAWLDGGGRDR